MSAKLPNRKFRVVETFAGIGAQHKALTKIFDESNVNLIQKLSSIIPGIEDWMRERERERERERRDLVSGAENKLSNSNTYFDIVATTEWDINSNISYSSIHHGSINCDELHDFDKLLTSSIDNLVFNFENPDTEYNNELEYSFFSLDSKNPITKKTLNNLDSSIKHKLLHSIWESNNQVDVTQLNAERLLKSISRKIKRRKNEIWRYQDEVKNDENSKIDLLTYSFPCQDLSSAGSFHGFNQGMSQDSGTRSSLLWRINKLLKDLTNFDALPKYLMLENVPNMLSEKHVHDYFKYLNDIRNIGYITYTFVINSFEHGSGQSRKRVYGVSIRTDEILSQLSESEMRQFIISDIEGINAKQIVGESKLSELLKIEYTSENGNKTKYFHEAKKSIPNSTDSRRRMGNLVTRNENDQPTSKSTKYGSDNPILYSKNHGTIKSAKLHPIDSKGQYFAKYSRTITTKQDRHPNAGIIDLTKTELQVGKYKDSNGKHGPLKVRKSNYRFITPRESYLLMGFEESDYENSAFAISKTITNDRDEKILGADFNILWKQAGNSIVVNSLISVFIYILKDFFKET